MRRAAILHFCKGQTLCTHGKAGSATSSRGQLSNKALDEVCIVQVQSLEDLPRLPEHILQMLRTIYKGRDAVFDPEDPLPFLALHYLQMTNALLRVVRLGTPWLKLDLCSGKVVELGGD